MAVRGWGGSVATAAGVAAGAGAAQLGLGYGLGIIAWLPTADGAGEAAWVASLTWAVWIAATSTVIGAIVAQRLDRPVPDPDPAAGPPTSPPTMPRRIALAFAGSVGGLVPVTLVAVPARTATRLDTLSPQTIAAGYAVLGVLLGLLVAVWALHSPAVAANIVGTACWLWSLAVVAVIDSVAAGRGLGTAQLGVWQLTSDDGRFWFRGYFYWPGAALALGSALLIGALAARSAARLPRTRVGATVSGATGPLLVAAAYVVAAPRLVGIEVEQISASLMAPYAVVAGLAGSAMVAALAERAEVSAAPDRPDSVAGGAAGIYRPDGTGTGQPGDPGRPGPETGSDIAEPATGSGAGSAGEPDVTADSGRVETESGAEKSKGRGRPARR